MAPWQLKMSNIFGGKFTESQNTSENLGRPEIRSSRPFEHF
jgi:hypothetical protein